MELPCPLCRESLRECKGGLEIDHDKFVECDCGYFAAGRKLKELKLAYEKGVFPPRPEPESNPSPEVCYEDEFVQDGWGPPPPGTAPIQQPEFEYSESKQEPEDDADFEDLFGDAGETSERDPYDHTWAARLEAKSPAHYYLVVESSDGTLIGAPRESEESLVLREGWTGKWKRIAYPEGIHTVVKDKINAEFRLKIIELYTRLLDLPYYGEPRLRRHLLAPLEAYVSMPWEYSRPYEALVYGGEIPSLIADFVPYLKKLLQKPLFVQVDRLVSIVDLAGDPLSADRINIKETQFSRGEITLLRKLIGFYRV